MWHCLYRCNTQWFDFESSSQMTVTKASFHRSWYFTITECAASWGLWNLPAFTLLLYLSLWAQWEGEEEKANRKRGGKTTPGNGQAWSSPSPRGLWKTEKNGGKWLWSHLWCPNDPRGYRIGEEGEGEARGPNMVAASQNIICDVLIGWSCSGDWQPRTPYYSLYNTLLS